MKTINKIFMFVLLALSIAAGIAVLIGATHQLAVLAINLIMYSIIRCDLKKLTKN